MQVAAPALPVMVACDRRNMRLTQAGCVKLWRSAEEDPPAAWEGRAACRNCAVGAARAGVAFDTFKACQEKLAHVCVRCCDMTTKLVGGIRCVSCYNRAREVAIGRNRKGTVPKHAAPVGSVTLALATKSSIIVTQVADVTSPIEAAMLIARRSKEAFCFGPTSPMRPSFFRPPAPRRDRTKQMRLYKRLPRVRACVQVSMDAFPARPPALPVQQLAFAL